MGQTPGSESIESPTDFNHRIGLDFNNLALLTRALTHRSYINENPNALEDNERLEFLGDLGAVLPAEVVVFPDLAHGDVAGQDLDGSYLGGAAALANAATGAILAMYHGYEYRVLTELARMVFNGYCLILYRAYPVADFTTQPYPRQTVLNIDNRQPHARVFYIFQ